ncbi:hypothetical protein GH714_031359 [Hevea brasiliensis]|uniref:Uncharacterized protein n=1 Tax=Hevea brasiliensis TaxID=3981 RepID=A0A6A6LGS6_HEVBR|nr:hypothetical protein GH714_031359 [Hevea brasiliensis]
MVRDVKILNKDEESNEHGMERYNILERCIINDWYHKEFVYSVEHREMDNISVANVEDLIQAEYFVATFKSDRYKRYREEYKKYRELEGDFEQITDIVIGNTQKMEYVKRQLRVLKVNLSEWNDGLLASAVDSENVGVANSDSSVAI